MFDKKRYERWQRLRRYVLLRDGYKCHYCGLKMTDIDSTADHIFPKSLGGENTASNLVACCKNCNLEKSNIPYEIYLKRIAA